ncbi:fimbria/pilus periplasmic chaperone [Citrobacter rodentium]|jgi:P pilus assembly protein, chaperone PapD|uniref:Fimbrial protein n=2 Tax=Citrobacter rodentium TaxID=67825 RepID=D2TJM5_CITRI|nr:fimbria/pilus periplasmic chaperone [Citrobacter rodentium]KIQ53239.1 fimbrial protein [Citrobacter rodentium]QBY29378.1 molecular chaperone [Citrobacter rodentium]UHO33220.1 fimbria/pilus periplasmic chaperone [Citrobacter rodentium NBRC 105723 = DSM 16636]CBG89663.1 putative fimbrial protein [Citrobacter rodentium ICC168]HAT8015147.1 molecular chaperone [Citrobacter rodentium NBRC 105723 = DSM 16636]
MKCQPGWLKGVFLMASMAVFSSHAVYLESTIFEIPVGKSFISKRIYNDSKQRNLYSMAAVKIDKPGPGGEKRSAISEGELLFTPLNFSLAPGQGEYFKIFYRGPADATERYYRILFREIPITLFTDRRHGKKGEAMPAIAIDTILIVRPRKTNLNFNVDEQKGVLKNTGNTFFKVIVHKGCHSSDDEAQIRYLLPGESWSSPALKANNKKFIVALQKYIPVGKGCLTDRESDR